MTPSSTLIRLSLAAALALPVAAQRPQHAAQHPVRQLLRELTDAPGPSGFEEPVRKIMVAHMMPLADTLRYDGLGSVIARQGASGPRVMIDAHMDELGGMIRRIRPDGFMNMQMLGGWLDQALPGQRWVIVGSHGDVPAVTTILDAHIATPAQRTHLMPRGTIFLDAGARNAADVARLGIAKGDPVAPWSPMEVLANGRYVAKAWDDRIGLAVMIEMMQRLAQAPHANRVYYAATVQEELGMRGAKSAAAVIKPDLAIALEVGIAGDVPGTNPDSAQEKLGGGPALFLYDSSQLPNRKLVAFIEAVARENHIPLQTEEILGGYGDDSSVIQKTNGGVPTVNLTIPTRYTHAHNSMIQRSDFDATVKLMVALVQRLDATTVTQLRSFGPTKP
jgi:putative aminopeptidase FrvX